MKDRRVAKRYALALFETAAELGKIEQIDEESQVLQDLFSDKSLVRIFREPQVRLKDKRAFLAKAFKDKVHPAVFRLLEILLEKGRIGLSDVVFEYYDIFTNRHRGIEEVRVITASEVDEPYVERLVAKLRRFTMYPDLRVTKEVDPGVIGGAKVYLGRHTVIDGTIAARLKEMRERLLVFQT